MARFKRPGPVFDEGVEFLSHGMTPMNILLGLSKIGGFSGNGGDGSKEAKRNWMTG